MISLEVISKATAILLAAFAANSLLRRSPAAIRHFIWTAAFAAILILPAAMVVAPKWTTPAGVPVVVAAPVVVRSTEVVQTRPSAISLSTLWWIGFIVTAARFVIGSMRTSWIARRARAAGAEQGVRIVESPLAPMPMTWGIARPVIILPAEAVSWDAERRRVVLLHELTHVRRHDLLAQAIAQAACCIYWFHPLAWVVLRALRQERESACDDGVLATGIAAHQYASHVMALARGLADRRASLADAPAMAGTSDLESRIRAMLDRSRDRRPLSRHAAVVIAASALVALLSLGSVSALAQGGNGSIVGTVNDPSGARVANATVRAINLDGTNRETTTANPAGEFQFASIPAGRYKLEFASAGFRIRTTETTLVAGANARMDAFLEIGSVSEAVTVRGGRGQTPARPAAVAQRVLVGGNVTQARLIRQPKPEYPQELQQAGIEGVVMLRGVIGKDGTVQTVEVVNTVDPRLAKAAFDAVRQWRYTPTLLNGLPVETITNMDLKFELGQ